MTKKEEKELAAQAEAARVQDIQDRIAKMKEFAEDLDACGSDQLMDRQANVYMIDPASFEEYAGCVSQLQTGLINKLQDALEAVDHNIPDEIIIVEENLDKHFESWWEVNTAYKRKPKNYDLIKSAFIAGHTLSKGEV